MRTVWIAIIILPVSGSCSGDQCTGFGGLYYGSDKPFKPYGEITYSETKGPQLEIRVTVMDTETDSSEFGESQLVRSDGENYYLEDIGWVGKPSSETCFNEIQILAELRSSVDEYPVMQIEKCTPEEWIVVKTWNDWPLRIMCSYEIDIAR